VTPGANVVSIGSPFLAVLNLRESQATTLAPSVFLRT
jgi:hypothetical protein